MCPKCKNYGPQGDICTTCCNPRYYYGNDLTDTNTLPLLARLMASAIANVNDNNIAFFYASSLIDFYIPEYYAFGPPAGENNTEDPNYFEPASI
jgi:hypothetical protein